jgi:small-conductance mechanosensitive channel
VEGSYAARQKTGIKGAKMKTTSPDILLDQLRNCTLALEKSVYQEELDPDEWVKWLEERQQIIDQLDEITTESPSWLTKARRKLIQQICETDQRLISSMNEKCSQIRMKLGELQQLKRASDYYNNAYAVQEYGAFFDKRK